mgnify:CR=1 FL=1
MSIGSTRKVSSASSVSKTDKAIYSANNHSQFVENIDTRNNVLVRDDNTDRQKHSGSTGGESKQFQPDFTSATPDISTSIEALALSGVFDESSPPIENNNKVNVYSSNQSIIKDEEIERTGRNYLKHFYEKNEHIIDVDELV